MIVLPSYREGFSKSLLEAAAIGRAIITTNTPGCREGIVPGVTGELIPIKKSKAIVKSIEELLFDRNKLIEMGKNSRKRKHRVGFHGFSIQLMAPDLLL